MKSPQVFLHKVGIYLVERCKELGYIPLITKTPPPNKIFPVHPSEEAVYIKLFGSFNYTINTVHGRFGVLDPKNMTELGSLEDDNLCLTGMDKYLLISSLVDLDHNSIHRVSRQSKTLQDIYNIWSNI
jgi:hypothetical protein